ncbi:tyrosine-type recombinase/integrase [Sciscionella sediminilitoris]|uniref:tyrosine-type recombinase/integrase n=1 Tax=Sciscionella sediminilitoris TaxID=1445613 RepID=UPI0007C651E3|nr:tyrosine-type recombinase/integrase [Sciscionella sp. SE31]
MDKKHRLFPSSWLPLVVDWERKLTAENKSSNTVRLYRDAVRGLAIRVGDHDPTEVTRSMVRDHIAHLVETTSAGNADTNYRALRQWFKFLVAEDEITEDPMRDTKRPIVPDKPVPVVSDDLIKRVLAECDGKDFTSRRDTALVRLFFDAGARRSEIANLELDDIDLSTDTIRVIGKGRKARVIPFSRNTGMALSRYLRVRRKHPRAHLEQVWLGERGRGPLTSNGIGQMLRRRGRAAGVERELGRHLHAHLGRHVAAHQWQANGGSEGDLMLIMGWSSPQMPRRYGRAAAIDRAHAAARNLRLGDRF